MSEMSLLIFEVNKVRDFLGRAFVLYWASVVSLTCTLSALLNLGFIICNFVQIRAVLYSFQERDFYNPKDSSFLGMTARVNSILQ